MNQQKEMQLLDDKMHKLDSHLQLALKEKNALISANIHKDKEIANLLHTQTALKANVKKNLESRGWDHNSVF